MQMPLLVTFLFAVMAMQAQSNADPKSVPVIDADLGPCSADFVITNADGSPIYAASIKVQIAYGFLNARKLDLEVGTNAAGEARFTGLPEKSKLGLFFRASEGGREASAFDDPAKTCAAKFTLALRQSASTNKPK